MAKPVTTRLLSLPAAPCIRAIAPRSHLAALVSPSSAVHLPLLSTTTSTFLSPHRHFSRSSPSANFALWPKTAPQKWSYGEAPRSWTFEEVQQLSENPEKGRIIIDVREPSELAETGRIPGSHSMPLNSNPDGIFLPPEAFFHRFGFVKPGTSRAGRSDRLQMLSQVVEKARAAGTAEQADKAEQATAGMEALERSDAGEEITEVVFYCKAGVRSKEAAQLAGLDAGWPDVHCGEMSGGWTMWAARGGKVQKEEK